MDENLVVFKGNTDGLYIYINEGRFEEIKKQLDAKLKKAKNFFQGGKVINFKGRDLTEEEENELRFIINEKYGLKIDCKKEEAKEIEKTNSKEFFEGIKEGETKFVKTTIRSGQSIEYDGNIVIFGDVNPGAVIKAKGNIVVLGNLRGIAHAGSDGNRDAIIFAFRLKSMQLRIADIIARSPDGEISSPLIPEIAKIKNDIVVVIPYSQKK
ncbi:MAG: septum site-determining protein MinC [Firmicutes bacterium]|nr:septum site-determining protein MinC [Bacillota bacterium]